MKSLHKTLRYIYAYTVCVTRLKIYECL
ncbi:rCG38130 [Rattus norvegicus]|uniref:RCG38130 n=1 Tax=Rattus norvegicus TaxID=10116 RepID=A6IV77_RAT|nr:rCG38130 [Rattus norvegicus]